MIHYPKYNIPPSNSLQNIKQNHWTTKYRSLTYIYFMRSIFVSHWSIIQSMTFIHQIVFKMQSKITGSWNIGHRPLYIYLVNLCVTLIHYIKYDLHPSNSLQDIRQNHWTMKYMSLTHIRLMRPTFVSHWSIIPNIIFLYQAVFKILSKITGPWNIGHWPTYKIYFMRSIFVSHWAIIQSMTFINQIVFKI